MTWRAAGLALFNPNRDFCLAQIGTLPNFCRDFSLMAWPLGRCLQVLGCQWLAAMRHFAVLNGLFRGPKRPLLQCQTARFALRCGMDGKARAIM